ncbi:flagellar hook-associated protein 3 FlgL [Panacagrimonas perspica]|uniref:Flagellar hook-associated protein 3 FlgL n=1 Tax=Panacagrimonas perspica TaxID=381431 RepID=A0A4V3F621_9GAMM|nr:flagellar hook-associated protein FlgL [Panacagrimonas perspica]TDU31026.1 flagellar hook-associated protein 3 FlgL [Panacagrimonas perspica]THD01828.1 flagellar hook-associated protein 3 [Panacagrimonas perspica]
MRVSTAALHAQGVANILRNQSALAKTQNELALATRLVSAKDDPGAWARAAGLDQQVAQFARYQDNASVVEHRLGLEETALTSATEVLDRVRELALQANSANASRDARQSIAQEMQSQLEQLLAISNSGDGEGRYLFAGTNDGSAPFSMAAVGANYSGNASQRLMDIGPERSVALGDTGAQVFQNLRGGNGTFAVSAAAGNTGTVKLDGAKVFDASAWDGGSYTVSFAAGNYQVHDAGNTLVASGAYQSGTAIRFRGAELTLSGAPVDGDSVSVTPSQTQDMFTVVQNMIALVSAMPADAAGRAHEQTNFFGALQELDTAMERVMSVRATVGHRLNAVDDAGSQIEALDVQANSTLSSLRDLDYAEATARLNLQMTALQAAQQSYSRIQGMSLFDFLR